MTCLLFRWPLATTIGLRRAFEESFALEDDEDVWIDIIDAVLIGPRANVVPKGVEACDKLLCFVAHLFIVWVTFQNIALRADATSRFLDAILVVPFARFARRGRSSPRSAMSVQGSGLFAVFDVIRRERQTSRRVHFLGLSFALPFTFELEGVERFVRGSGVLFIAIDVRACER